MNWDELEQKHKQQITEFLNNSQKAFKELMNKHQELHDSFYFKQQDIPSIVQDQMKHDLEVHDAYWGNDGIEMKHLKDAQKAEIEQFYRKSEFKWHLEELKQRSRETEKNR